MPVVLFVVGILAFVGVIIYIAFQVQRKRTEAMSAVCQAMGFVFTESPDVGTLRAYGDQPLFDRGHSRNARNLMTGRTADREVMLFDYQYTVGGGKNSHTYSQTVALYPNGASGLPDLVLAPENVFHKIGQIFGYQDIDFDQSPEFSSHYLLRGEDEMAIRGAFTADAIAFFAQDRGWQVEIRGGHVVIYRSSRRCKPPEAPAFLAETLRVLLALHPAA